MNLGKILTLGLHPITERNLRIQHKEDAVRYHLVRWSEDKKEIESFLVLCGDMAKSTPEPYDYFLGFGMDVSDRIRLSDVVKLFSFLSEASYHEWAVIVAFWNYGIDHK